jgi:hypothetical protein
MKRKINEQGIQYDGPERMAPDIQSKIEKGETPLSDNPAFPESENQSTFEELISSKRFKDVVDKVKRYTGMTDISGQNAFMQLQRLLMSAVQEVKQIENGNEAQLEDLAVELVKREMSIPDDAFQYDVKLLESPSQMDTSKLAKQSEEPSSEEIQQTFGVSEDEAEEDLENFMAAFDKFDLEKAKRRFINSLIQGASKKGHYMFSLVEQELNQIDPKLLNLYGVLMSINDLLYWIIPDEMMDMMAGSGGGVAGTEEIDDTTDPPTIKARGVFFPVLVHEVLKGVYEVMGTQGLPDDPKAAEMVMASQDTLPYEVWDLRLGPVIWEKFTQSYPDKIYEDDLKEIQNYLFSRFSALSTEQFFELAKEIMGGTENGKKAVAKMVEEIIEELKGQAFEDALSGDFDDDDDFNLDNFLGTLGIGPSK